MLSLSGPEPLFSNSATYTELGKVAVLGPRLTRDHYLSGELRYPISAACHSTSAGDFMTTHSTARFVSVSRKTAKKAMSVDCRGVTRGSCIVPGCSCFSYDGTNSGGVRCDVCRHPPAKHAKSSMMSTVAPQQNGAAGDEEDSNSLPVQNQGPSEKTPTGRGGASEQDRAAVQSPLSSESFRPLPTCSYPDCQESQHFDLNTGEESVYCPKHMSLPPLPLPMTMMMMKDPMYILPSQFDQAMEQSSDSLSMQQNLVAPPNIQLSSSTQQMEQSPYISSSSSHSYNPDSNPQSHKHAVQQQTPPQQASGGICSLPGCKRPRYVDPSNGRVHDFCGRAHTSHAMSKGIVLQVCTIRALSQSELNSVQAHFQSQWVKGECPPITCVFEITNKLLKIRWDSYRQKLPSDHQNVEKHYHGTKLKCDIVNAGSPCTDIDCGICGISELGMSRVCIRKNINFQRFGHGFYFAQSSSKCHNYTQGVHTYRAMLQVDILPGKKHNITNSEMLTRPPDGYHSVYRMPGQELNYAELVIYNPDCVMPRYIIVYVRDGVQRIAK